MFKEYHSKPVVRLAYEVVDTDSITEVADKPATSTITTAGSHLEFKHYEPVAVGDYIVYLTDTDVYHCSKAVFLERNIVPAEE